MKVAVFVKGCYCRDGREESVGWVGAGLVCCPGCKGPITLSRVNLEVHRSGLPAPDVYVEVAILIEIGSGQPLNAPDKYTRIKAHREAASAISQKHNKTSQTDPPQVHLAVAVKVPSHNLSHSVRRAPGDRRLKPTLPLSQTPL